nr:hypothetical protein [uncultured Anaeromusa sp.]
MCFTKGGFCWCLGVVGWENGYGKLKKEKSWDEFRGNTKNYAFKLWESDKNRKKVMWKLV